MIVKYRFSRNVSLGGLAAPQTRLLYLGVFATVRPSVFEPRRPCVLKYNRTIYVTSLSCDKRVFLMSNNIAIDMGESLQMFWGMEAHMS